ncbi:MAG: AraC family transcriptional regulator [Acutalibacteraceae bacterium]
MAVTFNYNESKVQVFKIYSGTIDETVMMHAHTKNGYELHLIDGGKGILDTEYGRYHLSKNSLYVTGPNVLHKQTPDFQNPMHELCVYFKISKPKKADKALELFTEKTFWIGKSNAEINRIFNMMLKENINDEFLKDSILSSLAIRLIVELTRLYHPKEKAPVDLQTGSDLNENRSWILDQLLLEDCSKVTLDDFAENMGVSSRQAERIIKEYYGSSFKKLRYESKMAMAATLLEKENISVEECAIRCGYTSASAFINTFKKKYGITPKVYKQSVRTTR